MTARRPVRWDGLTESQRDCVRRATTPADPAALAAHVAGCLFCQALAHAVTAARTAAASSPLARAG